MKKTEKKILIMLALAQFILTLDSTVMNVSISQLVVDLNTSVSGIQVAITFYTLVMTAFMIPGAKISDLIGRKKAFLVGLTIYATGSFITAISPNLTSLLVGWSLLEGLGAALMIPAMLSLIASNYQTGQKRIKAFATVAAIGAIGAAVGPIVGGVLTTYATWRIAFLGEVLVGLYILFNSKVIKDSVIKVQQRGFDYVGTILSATSLSLIVLGILQVSQYGLITARKPFSIAGQEILSAGDISPTILLISAGGFLIALFALWQRKQVRQSRPHLIDLGLLKNKVVRSGTGTIFFQLMLLGGVMYGMALYLQIELGYNAMKTGLTLLPLSIGILILASRGDTLAGKYSTRKIVRAGFASMLAGACLLGFRTGGDPSGLTLAPSLLLFGAGMGVIASQLQNVVQSAVDESASAETSGLMSTFQYLGQSFGTAISGALVVGVFIVVGSQVIEQSTVLSSAQKTQLTEVVENEPKIISTSDLDQSLNSVPTEIEAEIISLNAETRKKSLSYMFILLALLSTFGLLSTKHLPTTSPKKS